jgi:hypothetical protein
MLHRVDLSVTQDFFIKIGGKRIVFNLEPIFKFHKLVKSFLGSSQRATATNILAVLKLQIVQTIIFQVIHWHYKRITKEEDFKQTLLKNASVSDVWQAQFTLRYTLENKK